MISITLLCVDKFLKILLHFIADESGFCSDSRMLKATEEIEKYCRVKLWNNWYRTELGILQPTSFYWHWNKVRQHINLYMYQNLTQETYFIYT